MPGRAVILTAGMAALTAVVFALVADHGTLARVQRLDDAWLRLMISGRAPPLTAIAKVFNVLGLVYVTLPVRIAVAGFLALRRRWWRLAAFTAAVLASEVCAAYAPSSAASSSTISRIIWASVCGPIPRIRLQPDGAGSRGLMAGCA